MKAWLRIILFLLYSSVGRSQSERMADSLIRALDNSTSDTAKLSILQHIVEAIPNDNIWPRYNEMAFDLAKKLMTFTCSHILTSNSANTNIVTPTFLQSTLTQLTN